MCIRRLATLPLNILYRSRPLNLAFREHGKGQEVNNPMIIQKAKRDNLTEGISDKISLYRVNRVVTDSPTE